MVLEYLVALQLAGPLSFGAIYGVGRNLNPDHSSYGVNKSMNGIVQIHPWKPSTWAHQTKDASVTRVVPFGSLEICDSQHCFPWGVTLGSSAATGDGAYYVSNVASGPFNVPKTETGDLLMWDATSPTTPPSKVARFGSSSYCMAYDKDNKRTLVLAPTEHIREGGPKSLKVLKIMAIDHDGSAYPRPVKQLYSFDQSFPVPGRPGEWLSVTGEGHCAYNGGKFYFTGMFLNTTIPYKNTSHYLHTYVDLSNGAVHTTTYSPDFFPAYMQWVPAGASHMGAGATTSARIATIGTHAYSSNHTLLAGFIDPATGHVTQQLVLEAQAGFGQWQADLGSAVFCASTDTWYVSAMHGGRVYLLIGYLRNSSVAAVPVDGEAFDIFAHPAC